MPSSDHPSAQKPTDVHAMAFLNEARAFHKAANTLHAAYEQAEPEGRRSPLSSDPVYFNYFHTVELALKSFLRFHDLAILGTKRQSHKLTELYDECRDLGLRIGPDDRFTIGNVVSLLTSGNEYQGFRYFNLDVRPRPELPWTREVVDALIEAVAADVDDHLPPGPAATFDLIVGKPRPQKRLP
jgi:hypothetical protein